MSRDNTQSPEIFEVEFRGGDLSGSKDAKGTPKKDPFHIPLQGGSATGTSNTITNSGGGLNKGGHPGPGHPGIGSLPSASLNPVISSSPKRGHPGLGFQPPSSVMKSGFESTVSMSGSGGGMSLGQLPRYGSTTSLTGSSGIPGMGIGPSARLGSEPPPNISLGHPGLGSGPPALGGHPGLGLGPPSGTATQMSLSQSGLGSGGPSASLGMVSGLSGSQMSLSNLGASSSLGHPGLGSVQPPGVTEILGRGHPGLGSAPPTGARMSLGHPGPPSEGGAAANATVDDPASRVMKVQTIGELQVPQIESDALASPLGSVPSLRSARQSMSASASMDQGIDRAGCSMPAGLGSVPGVPSSGQQQHPGLGSLPSMGMGPGQTNPALGSVPVQAHPGLGSVPGQAHPGLGSVPGQGLGSIPGLGSDPGQVGLRMTRGGQGCGGDSGLISSDLSFDLSKGEGGGHLGDRACADNAADGMSDDGSQFLGEFEPCEDDFLGGVLTKGDLAEGNAVSSEIEMALNKLTPEEVERRRKMLGRTYR